jgi:hypothetical protein
MFNNTFKSTALRLSVQADDQIIAQCNCGQSIGGSFNSPCVSQPSERSEEERSSYKRTHACETTVIHAYIDRAISLGTLLTLQ